MNRASNKFTGRRRWPRAILAPLAGCFLGVTGCLGGPNKAPDPLVKQAAPDSGVKQVSATDQDAATKDTHAWYDASYYFTSYFKPDAPPPPAETLTLRAEGLVADRPPEPGTPEAELAGARDLFRRAEYETADRIFHYHAEKATNTPTLRAEARFYEAECQRLQGNYPKAADLYTDLLNKFQNNPYREQALQHAFDIANFWLQETREEMNETREKREGKRWFVWPRFISFEQKKPFLDREGRALEKLEQIRYNDINGPLADKALFLCGSVKFFNEDFKEADFFFSQIYEKHKNSPLAAQAVELAIISKHLSTGGADYDGRKVVEARRLVQVAFSAYPELASDPKKREFLENQIIGITMQQAEKDFKMAEFWRHTGHPGSAYWYYGLVIQRYPTTDFAKEAAKQMEAIKGDVDKENAGKAPLPKLSSAADRDVGRAPASPQPFPGGAVPGGRQ